MMPQLREMVPQLPECASRPFGGFMSLSDWTIANPENAGLRSEPLRDLVEWLDGFGQANIHSVLVVRQGRLLFEHYRAGEDQCWGEPLGNVAHGPDGKHDLRSVTKSVISLLLGIALDRKLIRDMDEAIIDCFPQYSDLRSPEKEPISLRHLLTMSALASCSGLVLAHLRTAGGSRFYRRSREQRKGVRLGAANGALSF
jgi:CubicO group peptidase (beta-lactamase class C family)